MYQYVSLSDRTVSLLAKIEIARNAFVQRVVLSPWKNQIFCDGMPVELEQMLSMLEPCSASPSAFMTNSMSSEGVCGAIAF